MLFRSDDRHDRLLVPVHELFKRDNLALLRCAHQIAVVRLGGPRPGGDRNGGCACCHVFWDVIHSLAVTITCVRFCTSYLLRETIIYVTIHRMIIGDRLRLLRETKKLSQGDIEKRTGLLRCYISRVENGHTVPAIETLEKLARAMEIPLYQLFYDGEEPPELPNLPKRKSSDDIAWGSAGKEARFLGRFRRVLGRVDEGDRRLLLYMAQKMARR